MKDRLEKRIKNTEIAEGRMERERERVCGKIQLERRKMIDDRLEKERKN